MKTIILTKLSFNSGLSRYYEADRHRIKEVRRNFYFPQYNKPELNFLIRHYITRSNRVYTSHIIY